MPETKDLMRLPVPTEFIRISKDELGKIHFRAVNYILSWKAETQAMTLYPTMMRRAQSLYMKVD